MEEDGLFPFHLFQYYPLNILIISIDIFLKLRLIFMKFTFGDPH